MEDKIIMKGCCFMEIKRVTCIQDEKGNSFHVGDQCEITNLNDEVIVTVIATGFEQPSEPLYHSFNSTKREDMYKDNDDDYNDNDLDIPPFIRDRQDF